MAVTITVKDINYRKTFIPTIRTSASLSTIIGANFLGKDTWHLFLETNDSTSPIISSAGISSTTVIVESEDGTKMNFFAVKFTVGTDGNPTNPVLVKKADLV